jgi:membrane protease YdiL (CAAX protease family)
VEQLDSEEEIKAPLEDKNSILQLLALAAIIILASGFFYQLAFWSLEHFFSITNPTKLLSDADSWSENRSALILMQLLVSFGSFILPGILFVYLVSIQPFQYLKIKKPPHIILAIISVIVMFFSGFAVDLLVKTMELIPFDTMDVGLIKEMVKNQASSEKIYITFLNFKTFGGFLVVFLLMAIIPALGEELVFRGLIQNIFYQSSKNQHIAIGFTAFWFALIHIQLTNFLALLFMGLILGYLYHWTKNLWIPIIAHLFNNGLIVIVTAMGNFGWIDFNYATSESFPWYISVLGVFILIPLLLWYKNKIVTEHS